MANGDAAAAKGLHTVEATDDVKVGYDDINIRGDELAAEIDARTAADALKFDAAKVIISTSTPTVVNGAIWLKPL
jgi:hypothetical protein